MENETIWLIPAIILMAMAMGWLALAKPVHWKQVEAGKPISIRLQTMGIVTLILSAICCLRADHASMAILVWFMLIAATAISVGMILSTKPSWLKCLTLTWLPLRIFSKH